MGVADYFVGVAGIGRGVELGHCAIIQPLARSDCNDGVISLDNIHNDVSMYKTKGNPRGVSLQTVCRKFLT